MHFVKLNFELGTFLDILPLFLAVVVITITAVVVVVVE